MANTPSRFLYTVELRTENGNSTEIYNSTDWSSAYLVFEEACQDQNYRGNTVIIAETVKHILHPHIDVKTYNVKTFYVP
jgi:hypothetical protein